MTTSCMEAVAGKGQAEPEGSQKALMAMFMSQTALSTDISLPWPRAMVTSRRVLSGAGSSMGEDWS